MKKKRRLLLCIPILLGLLGCGSDKMEPLREVRDELAQEEENMLEITKTDGDFTVTLNQIAFEEGMVVLDYTVKSENLTPYADVLPKIMKNDIEISGGNRYDLNLKSQKEKSYVMFFEALESEFSEEDIGKEVEIQFESMSRMTDVDILFPVKIQKVHETEKILVGKKLEYQDKDIIIDYIERSKFYTAVYVKNMDDSMDDFCLPRVTDSDHKEITFFGGETKRFLYERLGDDCEKINITMVQYEYKDRSETVSEMLEIKLK